MSFLQIVVRQRKGRWSVISGSLQQAFEDCEAALKAAVDLANAHGKEGKPALVSAESKRGQFKTIWTYGADAYPPSLAKLCPGRETRQAVD